MSDKKFRKIKGKITDEFNRRVGETVSVEQAAAENIPNAIMCAKYRRLDNGRIIGCPVLCGEGDESDTYLFYGYKTVYSSREEFYDDLRRNGIYTENISDDDTDYAFNEHEYKDYYSVVFAKYYDEDEFWDELIREFMVVSLQED